MLDNVWNGEYITWKRKPGMSDSFLAKKAKESSGKLPKNIEDETWDKNSEKGFLSLSIRGVDDDYLSY